MAKSVGDDQVVGNDMTRARGAAAAKAGGTERTQLPKTFGFHTAWRLGRRLAFLRPWALTVGTSQTRAPSVLRCLVAGATLGGLDELMNPTSPSHELMAPQLPIESRPLDQMLTSARNAQPLAAEIRERFGDDVEVLVGHWFETHIADAEDAAAERAAMKDIANILSSDEVRRARVVRTLRCALAHLEDPKGLASLREQVFTGLKDLLEADVFMTASSWSDQHFVAEVTRVHLAEHDERFAALYPGEVEQLLARVCAQRDRKNGLGEFGLAAKLSVRVNAFEDGTRGFKNATEDFRHAFNGGRRAKPSVSTPSSPSGATNDAPPES